MDLGNFSLSLTVKDLDASLGFYRAFGFEPIAGDPSQRWVILKNGDAKIGLFQGMFDENLITFNPPDARALQAVMQAAGHELVRETDPGDGPTHFVVRDPDGNAILVDQHE